MRGGEALERLLACPDIETVLDIGSGRGAQAAEMRAAGRKVTTVSLVPPADVVGDYLAVDISGPFDAVWACHVLEHQPNVGAFLRRCFAHLRDDGLLAITVPPLKHAIVGGHLALWNAGLLLYHLVVAGFDCRAARVSATYDNYNLSVLVRKQRAVLPPLVYDAGDIETLAQFFPLPVAQGFDGRLSSINW